MSFHRNIEILIGKNLFQQHLDKKDLPSLCQMVFHAEDNVKLPDDEGFQMIESDVGVRMIFFSFISVQASFPKSVLI